MTRHWLSALAIVVVAALGLGASVLPDPLKAKLTRSHDAIIILNMDEFTWRSIYVTVVDELERSNRWKAYIHELGPGESYRLSCRDLVGEVGPFVLQEHPEASMYIEIRGPEWVDGAGYRARRITAIPLEHQGGGPTAP